ncbi:LOW QUALITY PROTEIN: hypothetical protein CFOL_v3_19215, partial [Cephalotus follicularis]
FHESWERLKDLIQKCPYHTVPKWQLVQCFYDGLTAQNRQMVDASCGGTFMHNSEDEAWKLFESFSENSLHHLSSRVESSAMGIQKKWGIYEVSQFETIKAKVDLLSQKLDKVLTIGMLPMQSTQTSIAQEACALCASPKHYMSDCSLAVQYPEFIQEQAQAIQGFSRLGNDPFSNTYNPGWRNQPNFSWKQPNISHNPPMDEMMELFKQVQINLPLLDVIQVPAYANFLKDLCTTKRKLKMHIPKTVYLTEWVSAVISNKLPHKIKNLGAPLISCKIGNLLIERALLDLGASVNILPVADRSLKISKGFIEDVLLKVDELYFPVDFLVLDME